MVDLTSLEGEIRRELIKCAKKPCTITYARLADWVDVNYQFHYGPDEQRFHNMLGNVSTYEVENGRPMLSVIVVRAEDSRPGPGFFWLAKELDKQKPGVEDEIFFINETRELFDYWKSHEDPDARI